MGRNLLCIINVGHKFIEGAEKFHNREIDNDISCELSMYFHEDFFALHPSPSLCVLVGGPGWAGILGRGAGTTSLRRLAVQGTISFTHKPLIFTHLPLTL